MKEEALTQEQVDSITSQLNNKPTSEWLPITLNARSFEAKQRVYAGVLQIQLRQLVPRTLDGQPFGTTYLNWSLNTYTRILKVKR